MSIENPVTYSDWYWANSVDATKAFNEQEEKVMSPLLAGFLDDIPELSELPSGMTGLLSGLANPSSPGLGGFLVSAGGEFAAEIIKDAISPAMSMLKRSINRRARETWLTGQQACILSARKKITDDYFYLLTASEGYEDIAADSLFTSLLPYPSVPEIMSWARYATDYTNIRSKVWEKFDVPVDDWDLWEWLSWQKLTTMQTQDLYKRGAMTETEFITEIGRQGWQKWDYEHIKELSYMLPNALLLIQGGLMQGSDDGTIINNISKADIHPTYSQLYYDAVLTKPSSQDVVAYHLRQDNSLANVEQDLRRIGIHPKYYEMYKTLAYQIPPVADIITMAVREAFSPEVAVRFGQYEDFPSELEQYASMKGLSKEWAQRYWAAHWSLPSPQQGFEMLHRGVIDRTDLDLLLRAQDVMPYWREKLTQIAFKPLTRVDVRRMYKEGVLDEREVYESYLDQGYDATNAQRMAEFTVRQTLSSLAKFSSTDVVKAFTNRMIDRSEAVTLLGELNIRGDDANYIVSTAEYKRLWEFTDEQIKGIKNLYRKRIYSENQTRDSLARLNLPADQINVLMQQWYYDKVDELDQTWTTAQTLKFLKRGIITADRARQELHQIGYTQERIDVYLRDNVWTQPES